MADVAIALLDVNVLVALTWPQHVHHARAQSWLSSWVGAWATTPITETALVRLSMNPRVVGSAVTAAGALALLDGLRSHPDHRFIDDRSSLADPLIDLSSLIGHGQVTDAHLVNLSAAENVVLATLDASLVESVRARDRQHVLLLPR